LKRRNCLALIPLSALACSARRKPKFDYGEPGPRCLLRGKVLRLRPEAHVAPIEHEKIEGWMDPMIMEFPIAGEQDFVKLKEGAVIRATVNVNDLNYWLTGVTVGQPIMGHAALAALLSFPLLPAQTRQEAPQSRNQVCLNPNARVPVNPSALVHEITSAFPSGAALDAGMGNGRNAIYLARIGRKVTGVGLSEAAARRSREDATRPKVEFDARFGDDEKMELPRASCDFILCLCTEPLAVRAVRKFIHAFKPGRLLLIDGRHIEALTLASAACTVTAFHDNRLLDIYERLRILRCEARQMPPRTGQRRSRRPRPHLRPRGPEALTRSAPSLQLAEYHHV